MSTEDRPARARNYLPMVIIAALALGAGYWFSDYLLKRQPDLSGLDATHFTSPRPLQAFELVDHTGKAFRNADLAGHWSFVFFGYTHCPDVCPTTLSVLNSVARQLEEKPYTARFIFVTIDPERDTPATLAEYVAYFNGDFIGLGGSPEELANLTRQLGVIYARATEPDNPVGYLMDHTASVLLFDPDGHFHALFSPPLKAATITEDFIRLAQAYR